MKRTIKILCFILSLVSVISFSSIAFAQDENIGVTNIPPYSFDNGISTYELEKPTNIWDLSKNGLYKFGGWCNGDLLYSNYKFTGKTSMTITVTNEGSSTMTVKLLKEQKGIDWSASTRSIKAGDTLTWTASSLDSSRYYILQFSTYSRFSGNIK